jgi:hypothetical protein
MVKGAGDESELIGYFVFFWVFIFSKKFRQLQIQEWKESGLLNKVFMSLEAVSSFFCGVILPILILYWIFLG